MPLWAFLGMQKSVHYPKTEKKKMANIPKTQEVGVPKYSVFVGHGYPQ